jgi:hypothetical protein
MMTNLSRIRDKTITLLYLLLHLIYPTTIEFGFADAANGVSSVLDYTIPSLLALGLYFPASRNRRLTLRIIIYLRLVRPHPQGEPSSATFNPVPQSTSW